MVDEIRCVAPVGDHCGEAATWSPDENRLYWCDVNRFLIHALDPATDAVMSWYFDEPVVALALTNKRETLLVALASHLILWNSRTDARTDHGFKLTDFPRARLNDGRAGPNGEFWIGSMSNNVGSAGEALQAWEGEGRLFCIRKGSDPHVFKSGIGISNTLCWSPDLSHFYFGDSLKNAVWSYDYRDGSIANERPFLEGFARGNPDGSAMDADGYLWNCRFGGSCVVRVAPTGEVDRVVEMPVRNITTCAFGGKDFRTLYITTATILGGHRDRLGGSLFALSADVPGLPSFRFEI